MNRVRTEANVLGDVFEVQAHGVVFASGGLLGKPQPDVNSDPFDVVDLGRWSRRKLSWHGRDRKVMARGERR